MRKCSNVSRNFLRLLHLCQFSKAFQTSKTIKDNYYKRCLGEFCVASINYCTRTRTYCLGTLDIERRKMHFVVFDQFLLDTSSTVISSSNNDNDFFGIYQKKTKHKKHMGKRNIGDNLIDTLGRVVVSVNIDFCSSHLQKIHRKNVKICKKIIHFKTLLCLNT